MSKLPNPFDAPAVEQYRRDKAAVAAGGPQSAPATPPDLSAGPLTVQDVQDVVDQWAAHGPEAFVNAVLVLMELIDGMAHGVERDSADCSASEIDTDGAYQAAQLGKRLKDVGGALYSAGRGALWTAAGNKTGQFTTAGGHTVKFSKGAAFTRSVRYKDLEAKYPEAYQDCVTVTPTDPAKTARFYL